MWFSAFEWSNSFFFNLCRMQDPCPVHLTLCLLSSFMQHVQVGSIVSTPIGAFISYPHASLCLKCCNNIFILFLPFINLFQTFFPFSIFILRLCFGLWCSWFSIEFIIPMFNTLKMTLLKCIFKSGSMLVNMLFSTRYSLSFPFFLFRLFSSS